MSTGQGIRLIEEDEGSWSAIDEETGISSCGGDARGGPGNLDEAVALHAGEAGEPITDEDIEEWGLDSESVPDEAGVPDAPWIDEPR